MIEALDIHVQGVVQGVGFRPFVYRLAKKYLINGWVLNDVEGVFIHAEGETKLLDEFVIELAEHPPSAARVDEVTLKEVPLEEFSSFEIRFSDSSVAEETTLVSPDLATCADCERELLNRNDRRFHYPFINCTNCGPRFTIIDELPYDRKNTSMRDFPLCARCQAEYDEPLDRRFHAQPNACFECGPKISWRLASEGGAPASIRWGVTREESDAILAEAAALLRQGGIVAVKGLGGFHLVCDAGSEQALAELRVRKKRRGKAFAVMAEGIEAAKESCVVTPAEEALLKSAAHPIVLLEKRSDAHFARGLADDLPELGVMLPYTPVQHLLIREFGGMLVMTSGNVHEEPIVTDDDQAYEVLGGIADAFLGNDREIRARYDDSVVRVLKPAGCEEAVQVIRRARGYAPMPLELPGALKAEPPIFATGPEQKNAFCLARGSQAFVSQHIGDMENAETFDAWLSTKELYERLFKADPQAIVCDMHPEYLTTKWAHNQGAPPQEVQHHHAHIVSVMAENSLEGPVAGFAFDGTGYGVDKAIWGGEVLLCNLSAFERFANFAYVPMPGGVAAIKHPLRMAYGALWAFDLLEHRGAEAALAPLGEVAALCQQMIDRGINTPQTSSVGRLFDAASALLGLCLEPAYEGEGAILLEAAMGPSPAASDEAYTIEVTKNTATAESTALDTSVVLLDAAPAFAGLLDDLMTGTPKAIIAQRFHNAFANVIIDLARVIQATYGIDTIALSGGVFMNRYLIERVIAQLTGLGFTVALNKELPPNDGCISFGQAVVGLGKNIQ